MKKLIALLLAMIMIVSLSACNGNKQSDSSKPDGSGQNDGAASQVADSGTLDGILSGITTDFDSTIKQLTDELSNVYTAVGDSFNSYVKNEQSLKDWYNLAQTKADELFSRTSGKTVTYYKLIASSVDQNDSDALDDALDDFYDKIYEDAFDNFYDTIYEDCFDEIYDKYYDGILDDVQDSVEYGEWLDVRSDCYSDWLDARSDIYSSWLDERSDIYGDWLDIKSEFLYDDNFDVDDILGGTKTTDSNSTSVTTDKNEETKAPSNNESSGNEEWRQFLKDYEAWVDDYITIVKKYKDNPTDMSVLTDYTNMVSEMADWAERADEIELELEDTDAALEYSAELLRIAAKLAEAAY